MKKSILFLTALICLLLAGCGTESTLPEPDRAAGDNPAVEEPANAPPPAGPVDEPPWFMTCRIVSGAETGQLLLAENGEAGTGVYTLDLSDAAKWKLDEPLRNGQLINITFEAVLETWPAQFAGVSAVELPMGGFDDRCALYLQVLEDLWEVDPALSEDVEVVGVDLSQTSLSPAEQAAVAWTFAGNHGAEPVQGTLEELMEQGDITASPLMVDSAGAAATEPTHYFYHWENGCFFSITENPMEGVYSLQPVTFDAMKWRSSLAAYWFCDCTALQSALGEWSDYTVGAAAIS